MQLVLGKDSFWAVKIFPEITFRCIRTKPENMAKILLYQEKFLTLTELKDIVPLLANYTQAYITYMTSVNFKSAHVAPKAVLEFYCKVLHIICPYQY